MNRLRGPSPHSSSPCDLVQPWIKSQGPATTNSSVISRTKKRHLRVEDYQCLPQVRFHGARINRTSSKSLTHVVKNRMFASRPLIHPPLLVDQYDNMTHLALLLLQSANRLSQQFPRSSDWVWEGRNHGLRGDMVPRSRLSEDRGLPSCPAELRIWWRAGELHQGNFMILVQDDPLASINGLLNSLWKTCPSWEYFWSVPKMIFKHYSSNSRLTKHVLKWSTVCIWGWFKLMKLS